MKIPYFCSQIPIQMTYASILLPLALPGCFSYIVPPRLAARVAVGSRVVVPLGPRRFYTGIVVELQEQNPQPATQLKEVADVADDRPCVLPAQLALWQWMAHYYMCTEGEVMKAALPQGMKLESETWIVRNADFQPDGQQLNATDRAILQLLDAEKGSELKELAKKLGLKNPLHPVKRLLDLGAVVVRESLDQGFRPRTESRVELEAAYFDEAKLHGVLNSLQRAPAQQALLLRYLDLAQAPAALRLQNAGLLLPVTRHALCTTPQTDAALTQLRKKGVLAVRQVEVPRLKPFLDEADGDDGAQPLFRPKPLGQQQQRALQEVEAALQRKQVCLLHGVTSSGKTEVYIHLIEKVLQEGKQVLYLLPEIALTTQITTRLGRVFGRRMAVYHSKFPDAERVELWMRQVGPQPFPLILGVRSAIFLPFQNLGLVIVDEEHETSFKQQEPAPRYQARDTAIVMAARQGAKVVLGTATPALETYANVLKGKYELVEMKERYGQVQRRPPATPPPPSPPAGAPPPRRSAARAAGLRAARAATCRSRCTAGWASWFAITAGQCTTCRSSVRPARAASCATWGMVRRKSRRRHVRLSPRHALPAWTSTRRAHARPTNGSSGVSSAARRTCSSGRRW